MPADSDGDIAVMKGIEGRDVALARHAEYVAHAVDEELIDKDFGGRPGPVIGAHGEGLLGMITDRARNQIPAGFLHDGNVSIRSFPRWSDWPWPWWRDASRHCGPQ